jgi:hypothetical protein
MKALILFDGSKSSIRILQVACQDARQLETAPNNLIVAVLGLVPYGIDLKTGLAEYEKQADALFFQASQYVQGGEYNKVSGEIILCRENKVTEVLAEYFNEYQLDIIYMPAPSTYTISTFSPTNHNSFFAKIFRKSKKLESQPETISGGKPIAELIYPGELVKTITGKVVLNTAEGIVTRLSCLNNTHRTSKVDNAREAILSQGYVEVRPRRVENIRIKSLYFMN